MSKSAVAVLLLLTLQTASVNHVDAQLLDYPLEFLVSPVSVNTTLGSTAVFWCYADDSYYLFERFSVFWLVHNSTSGYSFRIQDSEGEIIIDGDTSRCFLDCYSTLSIPASEINNNTEIQCQASYDVYPEELQNSSIATLQVQGSLAAPSYLQQQVAMDDRTLQLNWTAPFTLAGVPILQYSIYVYDYTTGDQEHAINTTAVGYILSEPHVQCGVEVSVSAWNAVGEGERSAPIFHYTKEDTLADAIVSVVDSAPDVLRIACSFRNDSNARGCHVTVLEEDSDNPPSLSLTIFRDVNTSSSAVLECLTGLQRKNYSVVVREVKCDGMLANPVFVWPAISIGGNSQVSNFEPAMETSPSILRGAVIGLAAVVALLAAALIVAIVVILITKKRNRKSVDIPPLPASSSPIDNEGKEPSSDDLYENIELNPTTTTAQPTDPDTIRTEECAAYGIVGRQN